MSSCPGRKKRNYIGAALLTLFCCLFLGAVNGFCEYTGKLYKVGISVWTGYPDSVRGFKEAMAYNGFIESKNVMYLFGRSGLDKEKQTRIAKDFKEAGVDLVYSLTTPGTIIMKEIMPPTTPIVFSIVTYPDDVGLIRSFEYSGNNLVGTSNFVEYSYYVKLLKTILPRTKTLAIFHRKKEPNSKIQAANMVRLLKKEGISVIDLEPESVEEVQKMALEKAGKADVFMTTTDTLMQGGGEKALALISLKKKIPVLTSNKYGIENGATFGAFADFYVLGKMSGEMAARILKEGVKPSQLKSRIQDLPLILINKKSARILGIEIPENKLQNFRYIE